MKDVFFLYCQSLNLHGLIDLFILVGLLRFFSFHLYLQWPSILVFIVEGGRHHDVLDLKQKQLETKTEDICVIRWSKPSGVYIMNFYRPKYVTCKKTESGRHTGWPRDRGVCPGRVGAPSTLVEASCPSRTTSFFLKFLNIPKLIEIAFRIVLESVYLPYHILFLFVV